MVKDSLAAIASAEAAIGRPTATARRLVNASLSDNTRRAYAGALGQLDAWLDGLRLDDAALAAYRAELHARLAGEPSPTGEATARVLAGYRRSVYATPSLVRTSRAAAGRCAGM